MSNPNAAASIKEQNKSAASSLLKKNVRKFLNNKLAVFGLVVVVIMTLACIIGAIMGVDYATPDLTNMKAAPEAGHIFGTDTIGRDLLARVLIGGCYSILIGVFCAVLSSVIGAALGAIAGYFGGKVDMVIMRALDIFMSIPDLLFTMVVVAALSSSVPVLIIAMTLAYFTNYVRLVRSGVLNLVDQEYVEAARAGGSSSARIIISHIIPNTLGIILVNVTLNVSSLVIYQSTLSFIGLSLPAPAPEWGSMLSSARVDMLRAPLLVVFPALAIVLTAFSVNLLGDGLRDAMDPRLKS